MDVICGCLSINVSIGSYIHSVSRHLLSTCYIPENVSLTEDTMVIALKKNSLILFVMIILVEFKKNKQFLQNFPANE